LKSGNPSTGLIFGTRTEHLTDTSGTMKGNMKSKKVHFITRKLLAQFLKTGGGFFQAKELTDQLNEK